MMLKKKSLQQIVNISAGVLLGVLMGPRFLSPTSVMAQSASSYQDPSGSWLVSESFSPPSRGAPARSADGGSRGCGWQPGQKLLTPMIPSDAMAFTVSEYPTFFWYVPSPSALDQSAGENAATVRFVLIDDNQNIVYQKKLSAPSSGIMSHKLSPDEAPALAENKQYRWLVSMVCDSEDPSANPLVDGWVARIPVSKELQAELDLATESDRASIYARAGIWHEALTSLAYLLYQHPDDATILSRWSEFLRSVNLGQFTQEPLIGPEVIVKPKPATEMS
jgi:hypothetical protein